MRHGDIGMTKITFTDGKPLLRDGKVGTGQDCCCGPTTCSRCIRNGELDCQYTTQEECEDCTRTRTCYELLQTECDGECPEGFTPGEPVRVTVTPRGGCGSWGYYGYLAETAYAIATVGCGQILSVAIDPDYHPSDPPRGYARLGRIAPTITATVTQTGGSASGAVLAVNLAQFTDGCGVPSWYIDSISVVSPGSGYTMFEPEGNAVITIEDAPGDAEDGYGTIAVVSEVDDDGGIVRVYVSDYSYRWRESAAVPPLITPYTVSIDGGGGSGAVVVPAINTDTSSPTFGNITGFTVTNGGSGYVSLCSGQRPVESCDECPPRSAPEFAFCTTDSESGPCGTWQSAPCAWCCIDGVAYTSGYTQATCEDCEEGPCGKWISDACGPGPCAGNYHQCECQCLPDCSARPFAQGTQQWNGNFTLIYMGEDYPPGSTVPWSTINGDGVNDAWDSWSVYMDCSSFAGEPNGNLNRTPPFNWTPFFLPGGGALLLQVTIPCDACGYAIPSPSVDGFVLINVPAGNDVTVDEKSISLECP